MFFITIKSSLKTIIFLLFITTLAAEDKNLKTAQDHWNYANDLCNQQEYDKAITYYDYVIKVMPGFIPAYYNKAYALKNSGRFEEAINYYEHVLKFNPEHSEAHYGFAQALLSIGDFEWGWYELQWRLVAIDVWKTGPLDIQSFSGKRIMLRAEFGLGDTMQFIRYAQILKQVGAYVVVQTFEPLVPLFKLCNYIDEVIPVGNPLPTADKEIPLLNMPVICNTRLDTIPANIPYLQADPALVTFWREKLAHDTNFKIGICWQAKHIWLEDNPLTRRSIPLSDFAPLAQIPGVSLYSLQKINGTEQLNNLSNNFILQDFGPDFDETHGRFMDTAAVMECLDLIISVDTSVIHLAGALNRPVWVILPPVAEWRWMRDRTDTPWYPKMRLFRQQTPGDWQRIISNIVSELNELINKKENR